MSKALDIMLGGFKQPNRNDTMVAKCACGVQYRLTRKAVEMGEQAYEATGHNPLVCTRLFCQRPLTFEVDNG